MFFKYNHYSTALALQAVALHLKLVQCLVIRKTKIAIVKPPTVLIQ